ncbi:MAG: hypothetical protein K0U93_31130 [Gammaproteobacteria bacterium]|nr:hypothetical protein [Gammaproteobacteria bacterium]
MDGELDPVVALALTRLQVAHEVLACDPELADTEVFCREYGFDLANSANTIVVTSKSGDQQFAACVLLANCRLDVNKTVRKRLGVRRISFATAEQTQSITGMTLGGVTALGLPDSVPVWVDAAVMDAPYIILGGGNRNSKLKISPQVFLHTANTEIIPELAIAKTV